VAITGNGDYTLTINIPADGAAESILFLALDSTLNSYQQNADEEEILSDITWDITSILVDGVEIEYVPDERSLAIGNDGACWRKTVYSDWSKPGIYDINASVVNAQSIEINFTIGGIVGGDNQTTDVTTVTTTDTEPADTTTTAVVTDTSVDGKVLVINAEENTATIELADGSEVTVSLDLLGDDVKEDSKVNVKFENGQPVSVSLLDSTATTTTATTEEEEPPVTTTEDQEPDGTTVTTTEDGADVEPSSGVKGDVNGDGEVLANDLLLIKKHVLGITALEGESANNADINGDGEVLANDLLVVKKYILGMSQSIA
jgi:hypothetical protein